MAKRAVSPPLFGLAPGGVCLAARVAAGTGELLPHRFTLTPLASGRGGLLSVALSSSSPRLGVTQHPALWSPDFPPIAHMRNRRSSALLRIAVFHPEKKFLKRFNFNRFHIFCNMPLSGLFSDVAEHVKTVLQLETVLFDPLRRGTPLGPG